MILKELIENNCGNCGYWRLDESRGLEFYKSRIGTCEYLDNDFCCGGHESHEAGCIGGGGFQSKPEFSCKFWKTK